MQFDFFRFWKKPDTWHRYKELLFKKEINYILSCQNIYGGFSNVPYNPSYLETCYYSLVCLGLSCCEELCNRNVLNYILAHSCVDGGFGDQPGYKKANIFNTFYAVVCLEMLDNLNQINSERTISFVLKKLNSEGGFSESSEDPPSMLHTYWAILTLDILNSSHILNKQKIKDFITKCKSSNGLYSNYKNSKYGYIEYTAYSIILNSIMDLGIDFNEEEILYQISKRKKIKGFSSYEGIKIIHSDTFWALYILNFFKKNDNTEYCEIKTKSVWHIFINLILRLMSENKRVLSNEYKIFNIEEIENSILFDKIKFKELTDIQEIKFIGFELYKKLSLQTKKDLKTNKEFGVLLKIEGNYEDVLWENILVGNELLQLKFPTVRKNMCDAKEDILGNDCYMFIYDDTMASAINEKDNITQLLSKHSKRMEIKSFKTLKKDDFFLKKVDLIHLTGHCEENSIQLSKCSLNLNYLIESLNISKFNGILICNICNNSKAFLEKCREVNFSILCYYGTLNGYLGYEFIEYFYKSLITGNNVAEALRLSKLNYINYKIQKYNYLNYIFWGNPNLYLK